VEMWLASVEVAFPNKNCHGAPRLVFCDYHVIHSRAEIDARTFSLVPADGADRSDWPRDLFVQIVKALLVEVSTSSIIGLISYPDAPLVTDSQAHRLTGRRLRPLRCRPFADRALIHTTTTTTTTTIRYEPTLSTVHW